MDVSIFLAKLIGFYFVIVGIAYFIRKDFMRLVVEDFYQSPALIAISAIINLIIGLLIVLNHNIWEFSWKVVITIVGFLSLAKGMMHLYVPDFGKKLSEAFVKADIFVFSGVISFALGLYLLYYGYAKFIESFFT